ncbi:MAG: hypothetical protein K2N24_05280, partial [Lachnospiraceae bacterium]|nr:hypothetical protein [Lachnospiraceae bacterium]
LAAALAPQLIKYVRKSRRVKDIQAADEIQASYARGFITMSGQDVTSPASETGDVYIRNDSTISNPPQTLTDFAFLELGTIPLSSTDKDYYWHIEYTPATGKVNKISLTDGPSGSESHEVYPDSDDFAEGK